MWLWYFSPQEVEYNFPPFESRWVLSVSCVDFWALFFSSTAISFHPFGGWPPFREAQPNYWMWTVYMDGEAMGNEPKHPQQSQYPGPTPVSVGSTPIEPPSSHCKEQRQAILTKHNRDQQKDWKWFQATSCPYTKWITKRDSNQEEVAVLY